EDIVTRDDAVEYGNELMRDGLFVHVEGRHKFRDGNFFYRIASEYRATRPESRSGGWFGSKKTDKSTPSTPLSEVLRDSPKSEKPRTGSSSGELSEPGSVTPTGPGKKAVKF